LILRRTLTLLGLSTLLLAGCAKPNPEPATPQGVQQAWVQAVAGPGWAVRVITADAACPSLAWSGGAVTTQERAAPGVFPPPLGNVQPETQPNRFSLRACEAAWPAGAQAVQVGSFTLRAPPAAPQRIVLIGDTGCRLKASDLAFQSCKDEDDWPLATVLASIVAAKPDLIVHLGDLHYRESACPLGRAGCAGSPWGYGDDAWQADFFKPATQALTIAPWVFVRGNHEACDRGGQGWQRYLDAYPATDERSCLRTDAALNFGDFTEPFAVPISPRTQLIVFDSAMVGGKPLPARSPAFERYRAQLEAVRGLVKQRPQNWFLNHHPTLAYGDVLVGKPAPSRSGLSSVLADAFPARYYPPEVQTVLHGHIHLHEALGFSSDHPASLVIGNGASATYGKVDPMAALAIEPAPGAKVETLRTHDDYGFSILSLQATPQGDAWKLDALDRHGHPLSRCQLNGQKLHCD
jgi:3',5'-cyclic AMP phosphodiesterase CpdA